MILKAEDRAKLRRLLALSGEQREVFWRTCEEQKQSLIGYQMGISKSTVRAYMKKIYEALEIPRNMFGSQVMQKELKEKYGHLGHLVKEISAGRMDPGSLLTAQPDPEGEPPPTAHRAEEASASFPLLVIPSSAYARREQRDAAAGDGRRGWNSTGETSRDGTPAGGRGADAPAYPMRPRAQEEVIPWYIAAFLMILIMLVLAMGVLLIRGPDAFANIFSPAARPPEGTRTGVIPLTGAHAASEPGSAHAAVVLPSSTPGVSTPASKILYENHFDTFPAEIIADGKATLVNGQLVAMVDTLLVIGEDSWKDYSVSFQSPNLFCYSDDMITVGMRVSNPKHLVAVRFCQQGVVFDTVDPDWREIPYSRADWSSDCCEVSVQGDEFRYKDDRVTVPGFPQGKVYIWMRQGTAISDLVIKSIP